MKFKSIPVITIDGPSGVGKGTAAIGVANQLGWHYLDSGALYRIVALASQEQDFALTNQSAIVAALTGLNLDFCVSSGRLQISFNKTDVTAKIKSEISGQLASKASKIPEVRAALLEYQRSFLKSPGLVTDGRDMGTVVFPNAAYKFFLTAPAEVRAQRRHKELRELGMSVTLNEILTEMHQRDLRDSTREIAPLTQAQDALVIDTSVLTAHGVIAQIIDTVKS